MYTSVIHCFIEGHWGFYFRAIMNNATVNNLEHIFWCTYICIRIRYPPNITFRYNLEIAGHMQSINFTRFFKQFLQVGV